MREDTSLLDLVQHIYRAPTMGWQPVLDGLRQTFHGAWGQIHAPEFWDDGSPLSDVDPFDPETLEAYVEHYAALDPRNSALACGDGIVWARRDVISDREFEETEIYNDFLSTIDAEQCLILPFRGFVSGPNFLAVLRSEKMGSFTALERQRLQLIAPHVTQALALHRALHQAEAREARIGALMDRLPIGIIFLNVNGRLERMNSVAAGIVTQCDGIRLDVLGRCRAASSSENRVLQQLVASATSALGKSDLPSGGAIAISRPSGRRPYALRVIHLDPSVNCVGEVPGVAIIISDPAVRPRTAPEMLQCLYALTPAQAELAANLASGLSLAEACDARGITRETGRSQLKVIYEKTDTHRQGELIQLVLTSGGGLSSANGYDD
jgi:DNA-binding CsgD family transcriptional regulator/PAS domain-containing protein